MSLRKISPINTFFIVFIKVTVSVTFICIYTEGWCEVSINDVILYRDEKHEVLCIYDNNYIEIRELDSIRRNVKLVHQSAVQLLNGIKKGVT